MTNNFQAVNNDILVLYRLCSDHKVATDPVAGPPTRPVSRTKITSNYRISCSSMIIYSIIKMSLKPDKLCNRQYFIDVNFNVEKCMELNSESDMEFHGDMEFQ